MTKARNIANLASDGSALADGTINYTDVSGTPTLATVATSGSFNDLSNQPAAFDPNTLATVAVSGAYADVTGTPTLAAVATTGAYADVTGTPTLATVATTGAYGDLSGTPAAALPLAGGTLTGNVNLGDNVKANFGAGSDLEIYHDGINNRLTLASANTYIQTDGIIHFTDIGNNEKHLTINDDGAVDLYHNNVLKLATSATGVTVTGTVAATAVTGDGSGLTGVGGSTTYGAVGTYSMTYDDNNNFVEGSTIAGANIYPMGFISGSSMAGVDLASSVYLTRGGTALSGTWRRMCRSNYGDTDFHGGICVRIS
jgi:hypothetical protein